MFKLNGRVRLTDEAGFFTEKKSGTIIEADEHDSIMPYKVKFDGEIIGIWVFENEVELIEEDGE